MTKPFVLALLASLVVLPLSAATPPKAPLKAAQCLGCHGIDGWRMAFPEVYTVPRLGGQHAAYLEAAMRAYRSGERRHSTMQSVVSNLSDQDIAELAAYYAAAK